MLEIVASRMAKPAYANRVTRLFKHILQSGCTFAKVTTLIEIGEQGAKAKRVHGIFAEFRTQTGHGLL